MWTLARAQLTRDRGLLAILVVVLLLGALGTAIAADLGTAATSGVRAGIAALRGSAGGYRITAPEAADAGAQDARVRAAVAAVRGADGRTVPVAVVRDLTSPGAVLLTGSHRNVRAHVASIPDLPAHAALVAGRWPADAAQVSVQADAARLLGVRVGDALRPTGGGTVTVSGTWRVRDPGDPRWMSGDLALHGIDDAAVPGYIVIDPSLWHATGVRPLVDWTVLPRSDRITAAQLPALQAAPGAVSARLARGPGGASFDEDGGLQRALLPVEQRLLAGVAVAVAPVVLLALVGLLTLGELVRAREHARADERQLLRAWGASRSGLVRWALPDAAAVAIAALAGAGLAALPGGGDAWPLIGGAVGAVTIVLLLVGAAGARETIGRTSRGRARPIAEASLTGLVCLAAVIALVQLGVYGSPVLPTASGGSSVDPLAVSAPALAIVALAMLAVAAFPLLRRPVERRIVRGRGPDGITARHLVRRPRGALAPMLLAALAVATGVLAVAYSGSWQATSDRTRSAQVGTDVRITAATTLPILRRAGDAMSPAVASDVQVADQVVTMVQLPAAEASRIIAPVPGAVDPDAIARRLGHRSPGPRIPAGTTRAVLALAAQPVAALPAAMDVVVRDAGGIAQTAYATRIGDGAEYTITLPAGRGPFELRAIDLQLGAVDPGATVRVRSLRPQGGATIPLGTGWAPTDRRVGAAALAGGEPGVRVAVPATGIRVRLMPRDATSPVPIVVSASLAADAGLPAGSRLDMSIVASRGAIPVRIAAVVPVVPGVPGDAGVLADLGAVQDAVLAADLEPDRESEWWIRATDPASAAAALHGLPSTATVTTRLAAPEDAVLESARREALLAAGATILLAGATTTAVGLDEARRRRRETAVLRALGMPARALARARALELAALLGLGLVAGVITALVAVPLVVPPLVTTAIPDRLAAIPPVGAVDPLGAAALAALLLAGCAATIAGGANAVLRGGRRHRPAGELR